MSAEKVTAITKVLLVRGIVVTCYLVVLASCYREVETSIADGEMYRVKLRDYDALREAARNGDIKSANRLHAHFVFAEPDKDLAEKWLRVAADNGSIEAQNLLEMRDDAASSEGESGSQSH